MRKNKKVFFVFLTLLLLFSLALPAFANENLPDLSRSDGSITVRVKDGKGNPVEGGKLTIYQVAVATYEDSDQIYVMNQDFADSGIVLEDYYQKVKDSENFTIVSTEEMIAKLRQSAGKIQGNSEKIEKTGEVTFENLPMGLYLIVHEPGEHYTTLKPFLVSLPNWDENGKKWDYFVDASPKTGTISELPTETTAPTTNPPKEETEIPYTGQNWLPVWILAVGGITVFFMGIFTIRKEKHDAA